MTDKQKINLFMKSDKCCSICGKSIYDTTYRSQIKRDALRSVLNDCEIVKTKRGSVIVFHKKCYKSGGKSSC